MVKKWFWGQKQLFLRSSANIALNAHFLAKNHFFTITTPKPGYIYPNNFSQENFSKKKLVPRDPPWGTWGPYLKKGSVKYFPNVVFWTSLAPWVSPHPHLLCYQQKNLKIFQGAVWGVIKLKTHFFQNPQFSGTSIVRTNLFNDKNVQTTIS